MKALSLFAWLLCAGFILNAISGNWALDQADHGAAGVVGDIACAAFFAMVGAVCYTVGSRLAYQREYERQGNE